MLVPLAGGPNGALALEIASILTEDRDGELTAFTAAANGAPFDLEAFVRAHRQRIDLPDRQLRTKVVHAADVLEAILVEAEDHDLIVVGATREPLIRQFTRQVLPEALARRCRKPLVMAKAPGRLRSWIKRRI